MKFNDSSDCGSAVKGQASSFYYKGVLKRVFTSAFVILTTPNKATCLSDLKGTVTSAPPPKSTKSFLTLSTAFSVVPPHHAGKQRCCEISRTRPGFSADGLLGQLFKVGRESRLHVCPRIGMRYTSFGAEPTAFRFDRRNGSFRHAAIHALRGGSDLENVNSPESSPASKPSSNTWYKLHLPNYLTYARCVAIPALVLLFHAPDGNYRSLVSGLLFALASFTDWLDGYLARKWQVTSAFGAFLDPVADKLMVSTALILLSGRHGALVSIPSSVILAREIAVSALREWMAQRGQRDTVKVGFQGKVKTALTMVCLTLLLLVPHPLPSTDLEGGPLWAPFFKAGIYMLYASAFVTLTSGLVYFKAAAPVLMEQS